jgi:hypothetical protein
MFFYMQKYLHENLHPISTSIALRQFFESSNSKRKIQFSEVLDFTGKEDRNGPIYPWAMAHR